MTPEQHARAKKLFLEACEQPPDRRTQFVVEAAGEDLELRRHLESLLRHHDEADSTFAVSDCAAPVATCPDNAENRFASGTMVVGRYRIVELLGRGGMGEVYRADDLVLGQSVALKFLAARFRDSPEWMARLIHEVKVARVITHPNICRVHDIHVEANGGHAFISMEYVEGEDLRSLIHRVGRLAYEKALEVAREICVGLAAAHRLGILHRDLKPSNIMLDQAGCVRIMDFGLAAPRESITPQEIGSGTPAYMAPELFAGTGVSVQSDIYALGLVLYEVFTGKAAFEADSFDHFAVLHQRTQPTPPGRRVPDLQPSVDRLIEQCIEKDPLRRPSSALAVAAALPGNDPVELAQAAGVTPSPTFVAASSGRGGGLTRKVAIGLLASSFALLLLVLLLARSAQLESPDPKPVGVLVERARDLLRRFGHQSTGRHEAFGFSLHPAAEFFSDGSSLGSSPLQFASSPVTAARFWFRSSTLPLAPVMAVNTLFGRARTTLHDPPRLVPEMNTIVLSYDGQLLGFEHVPGSLLDRTRSDLDWTPYFAATGLSTADLTVQTPQLQTRLPVDQKSAWVSSGSGDSQKVRIEAAALLGQPQLFAVLRGASAADNSALHYSDRVWRTTVAIQARIIAVTIAALGAIPVAWRNFRKGRGDHRGAFLLAGLTFATRLVIWALGGSHVNHMEAELRLLLLALLHAWFEASLVCIFYLALEPAIRRFWPQTMIAWSRLLAGRVRDPLVGRDLLIGTTLGVGIVLVFELDRCLLQWIGVSVREPFRLLYTLEPLLSPIQGLASCLQILLSTLYLSLVIVTFLALARKTLRRTWLAILVTVVIMVPVYMPGTANPAISWLPLLVVLTAVVFSTARVGLVATGAALLVASLLLQMPLSFVPGSVGWDITLLVTIIIVAIAVYAAISSRRPAQPSPADRTAHTATR